MDQLKRADLLLRLAGGHAGRSSLKPTPATSQSCRATASEHRLQGLGNRSMN
jgi:hypothetical protein